jgi:hypothetical protein
VSHITFFQVDDVDVIQGRKVHIELCGTNKPSEKRRGQETYNMQISVHSQRLFFFSRGTLTLDEGCSLMRQQATSVAYISCIQCTVVETSSPEISHGDVLKVSHYLNYVTENGKTVYRDALFSLSQQPTQYKL